MIHLLKIYLFFALALMLMLGACNSDEPKNETSSIMITYNRAVSTADNSVTFSQSNSKFVIRNEATPSMQVQMILKVGNSSTVEFTTPFMPLSACDDENFAYIFEASNVTAGSHTINNMRGKINLAGPTFIQYTVDNQYQCYSTLQPFYPYTTTNFSSTESYTADDITYGVLFNTACDKGTLYLFDFHPDDNGRKYSTLRYDNLTAQATTTGYHLTGTNITPTEHEGTADAFGVDIDQYRARTINIDITQQGQVITGIIETGTEDNPATIALNGHFFVTNL